jgi:hypothetical protein
MVRHHKHFIRVPTKIQCNEHGRVKSNKRIGAHQEGELFVKPGHESDDVVDVGEARVPDLGGQGPDEVPLGVDVGLHLRRIGCPCSLSNTGVLLEEENDRVVQ